MSNMSDKQKNISSANEWINESEAYAKSLGAELDKKKSDQSFLSSALEKLNNLLKSGEQHSDALNKVSKSIQMAKTVPQLTGGQYTEINKQVKEVGEVIQKIQISQKVLKEFKEKISKFQETKTEGTGQSGQTSPKKPNQ